MGRASGAGLEMLAFVTVVKEEEVVVVSGLIGTLIMRLLARMRDAEGRTLIDGHSMAWHGMAFRAIFWRLRLDSLGGGGCDDDLGAAVARW